MRGSAAPAEKGSRRWGWSSSRPTRTGPPSSRPCDEHGIQLIGGQGELKGKIFRIGHIGWFDVFDICIALAGIEAVLADRGAPIERGVAVSAAVDAWSTTARV